MKAVTLVAVAMCIALAHPVRGEDSASAPSPEKERTPGGGQVIVRFEGGDVNRSLAIALGALEDLNLVPKQPYAIQGKPGPWDAIVAEMGLPKDFPPEMVELLRRFNPKLRKANWNKLPETTTVLFVRKEALQEVSVRRYFDAADQKAQQRRDTITEQWKPYVKDQSESRVDLIGYELSVQVDEEAIGRKAVGMIIKTSKGNAYPRYRPDAEPEVGHYYADIMPDEYWNVAAHQKADSKDQALMGGYLGMTEVLPACVKTPCTDDQCPDVMLVDSAVYRHWDVTDAIVDGSEVKTADEAGDASIKRTDKDVEGVQHGTYMLGIMAARAQNEAGLVGVHPAARIMTYDWDRYRNDGPDFVRRMIEREDATGNRLRVYVFATSWNVAESVPELVVGEEDTDDESLRTQHTVARQIMGDTRVGGGNPALWVVAAGQTPTVRTPALGAGRNIIPKRFVRGPMNLGDYPNVLVVTACRKCNPNDLTLEERVNYSNWKYGGVHVVAPGSNVISTAPMFDGSSNPKAEWRFARGHGTSPATALTAGVVSAMTSCYPEQFKEPWRVKERVQATSTPVFGGIARDRFSAGIVHAPMALRDPTKSYLEDKSGQKRVVDIVNWCVDALQFTGLVSGATRGNGRVATSSLLRLKRRSTGDGEWIGYSRAPEVDGELHRGDIAVHGPSRIKDLAAGGGGALVKIREVGATDDEVIGIEDVVDLLPAPGALRASGPCS